MTDPPPLPRAESPARSALRRRPDLRLVRQRWRQQTVWAVQDPLAGRYFHLGAHEAAILEMLDGRTGLAEIRRRFDRRFAPLRLAAEELQAFLAALVEQNLVLVDAQQRPWQLLARSRRERRAGRWQALLSVLAIRLPGINAGPLVDRLDPLAGWLFSPLAVAGWLLLAAAALLLVVARFDAAIAHLPELSALVAPANLPWLLGTLAVTKVLHEAGHALAARRQGGDCRELGMLLLVFTPTLYCDVSQCWMLPSKWRRMAVAAAGMYIELILATCATLVWWLTDAGGLNLLALNTMLVCSVGTLLLNGNPLLRYDGYYLLSDLVEVPNLAERASAWLRGLAAEWLLGLAPAPRTERPTWLVRGYALAAAAYRALLLAAILWGLNRLCEAYRVAALGAALTAAVLASLVAPPLVAAVQFARHPLRRRRWRPLRALASLLALAALVGLALALPLPRRVAAPLVLEYAAAESVYVEAPGEAQPLVRVGQTVRRGEILARLTDPAIQFDLARLTGQRDRQRRRLENLRAEQLTDAEPSALLPAVEASLADLEQRLRQLRSDAGRLTLRAPRDGVVLAAPPDDRADNHHAPAAGPSDPLDPRRRGGYLPLGTQVCLVGDPQRLEARLLLSQGDVDLVVVGQRVKLRLDQLPGQALWGRVAEIARGDARRVPRVLLERGTASSGGDLRPSAAPAVYEARVTLDSPPGGLAARSYGWAKISVAPQTLSARLGRWLAESLRR